MRKFFIWISFSLSLALFAPAALSGAPRSIHASETILIDFDTLFPRPSRKGLSKRIELCAQFLTRQVEFGGPEITQPFDYTAYPHPHSLGEMGGRVHPRIHDPFFIADIAKRPRPFHALKWQGERIAELKEEIKTDWDEKTWERNLDQEAYYYWQEKLQWKDFSDTFRQPPSRFEMMRRLDAFLELVESYEATRYRNGRGEIPHMDYVTALENYLVGKRLVASLQGHNHSQGKLEGHVASLSFLFRRYLGFRTAFHSMTYLLKALQDKLETQVEARWIQPVFRRTYELLNEIGTLNHIGWESAFEFDRILEFALGTSTGAEVADRMTKDRLEEWKKTAGIEVVPNQLKGTRGGPAGIQTHYIALFWLYRELGMRPGQSFVDVGSAFGRVGNTLGLLDPTIRFHGYEIAFEKVHAARNAARGLGLGNVRYTEQDLADPAFELEDADYYYFFDPTTDEVRRKIFADLEKKANRGLKFKIIAISGWTRMILNDLSNKNWLKSGSDLEIKGRSYHYELEIFETR